MTSRPRIGITLGDPEGIGPEVALKAVLAPSLAGVADFLLIGSAAPLTKAAADGGIPFPAPGVRLHEIPLDPTESGRTALAGLRAAQTLARERKIDALVTGPVSKERIARTGFPFTGHTEFFARECRVREPVMLFVSDAMNVALVTVHVPHRKVPALVTPDRGLSTIRTAAEGLRTFFDLPSPRIAVCGLNPHAGEGGYLGREDAESIAPAVEAARKEGIDCRGPLPGDTVFYRALRKEFDLVIAMTHDQGLAPIKAVAGWKAVNVTLGLPFVRTSVDHGTAFELAGKNMADPASMVEAIRVAIRMASRKSGLFE